jgi:hypothetical protein
MTPLVEFNTLGSITPSRIETPTSLRSRAHQLSASASKTPLHRSSSALLKTPSTIKSALKSSGTYNNQNRTPVIKGVKIDKDPPSVRVYKLDDSFTSTASTKENIQI